MAATPPPGSPPWHWRKRACQSCWVTNRHWKPLTQQPDWQSVLALSPAAKTMLETLGIWERFEGPSSPICDMAVFGDEAAYAAKLGLNFGNTAPAPAKDSNAKTLSVLAYIARPILARAVKKSACDDALAKNQISPTPPLTAFNKSSGQAPF